MRKYADYDFYRNEYHGKLSSEQFEEAIITTSAYIEYVTLGRSKDSDEENLKYAACAVCDCYADVYFKVDEESGKNIKSENTDGYSVSYVSEFADGTSKEAAYKKKAHNVLRIYLANTGLLSAKVGVIR